MALNHRSLINVEGRILLHILGHPFNVQASEAPAILTTRGIAAAVFTDRNHMSYYIKKMKSLEYIDGISFRVKGKTRKQLAYFLTEKGREKAAELKEELVNKELSILMPDRRSENLKFPKVARYLKRDKITQNITELEICKLTNHKGILDASFISRKEQKIIDFTDDAPKPRYFFGRVEELRQLKSWISDKSSYRVMTIYGVAGIGKTTLAAKLIDDYKGHTHIFWHKINEWDTIRSLLSHFADFLAEVGNDYLLTYLEVNRALDLDNLLVFLKANLQDLKALLVFDDLQKANEELMNFFISLIEITEQARNLKLIILTRAMLRLYDQRNVIVKRSIAELELEGLDFPSSVEILQRKGLPRARYKDIYKITSGNPLLLEINESYKSSKRYIYEEIFSQLTKAEQRIIEILSPYNVPIHYDAFFIDDEVLPGTIDSLVKKLILNETSGGLYETHEFIREFFYKRLSPDTRRKYHNACAEHYLEQSSPKSHLEVIYHYIRSQQYSKALKTAIERAKNIFDQGESERFLMVLSEFPEEQVLLPQLVQILMLKAEISFKIGDWEKSLQYYYHAVEVSGELGNDDLKARAYCELGHVLEEQNIFEDALASFQKSLKISTTLKDRKRVAEAKRGIGRVHWRKADYKSAEKYYKESLKALKNIKAPGLLGAVYIDLGNIYIAIYKGHQAIGYLEKAIGHLEKADYKIELARAYNSLGTVYTTIGKFEDAIKNYRKILNIAETVGDSRLCGYGWSNIGLCYAKLNQIGEAEAYTNKAKEIYERTNNENILFQILRTEGLINQNYRNWEKAINCFNKSIEIVEKLNVEFLLNNTLVDLARLYVEKGDPALAKIYFEKARQVKNDLIGRR